MEPDIGSWTSGTRGVREGTPEILRALALRPPGPSVIACPTCGRCQIDMIPLAESIEAKTRHLKSPLKIAVMGCVVNGPGEAKAADVGIAGGDGKGILIKKGKIIKTVNEEDLEQALLDEIEEMTGEKISTENTTVKQS